VEHKTLLSIPAFCAQYGKIKINKFLQVFLDRLLTYRWLQFERTNR